MLFHIRIGFFPDRDVVPGRSIFDAFEHAAAASGMLIVIVSADFHRDQMCRLMLDSLLMSVPLFTCDRQSRQHRQVIIPIVRAECQLPFGLISAELLIRCHDDNSVSPADMLRLRRLLKSNALF